MRGIGEWLGRNRGGLAVGVLGMLLVGLASAFLQRPTPAPLVVQAPPTPRPSPSPQVVPIAVSVAGEVPRPGLYHLPPGSRVDDAVKAAGGATDAADVHRLNLAARLADGQQVMVPRKIEALGAGAAPPVLPAPVNINLASVPELDRLPGVGPVIAQRIVAYREQHGPFTSVQQLRDTKLVNRDTFEKIKDLITVSS